MWDTIKKIAAVIGAALAFAVGLLLFTRRSQQKSGENALTPEKQKEIDKIEQKEAKADAQVVANHANIDALEAAVKANNGKLEGVSKEVQGMSHDDVEAELARRGLL